MALKDHSLSKKPERQDDLLEGLDDEALLTLRTRIDNKLEIDISKLDLKRELGLQYRGAMVLLESVQGDKDTPANQRAQVLNSVRGTISQIVKDQEIVYNAERLKRYEAAILKVLKRLGEGERHVFFDLYGEYLQESET